MAFVWEAEEPFKECLACRSNVWIFSKELCKRFPAVKVGIGSLLLNGIVDDTFQVTFRAGSPSAGFGLHRRGAERVNCGPKLLDVGEKGVYSSYTYD